MLIFQALVHCKSWTMAQNSQIDTRLRNLRKRLQQVSTLEQKLEAGDELSEEQREKVDRKAELERELQELLTASTDDSGISKEPLQELGVGSQTSKVASEASTEAGEVSPPPVELEVEEEEQLNETRFEATGPGVLATPTPSRSKARNKKLEVDIDDETLAWLQEGVGTGGATQSKSKKKKKSKTATGTETAQEATTATDTAPEEASALASPGPLRERLKSEPWADDPAAVEDIIVPATPKNTCTKAPEMNVEILENVQPFSAENKASERIQRLVKATTDLSMQAFGTDVIEKISKKSKYRLTLLVKSEQEFLDADGAESSNKDPWGGLLGFIAYRLFSELQCVSVAKLAVVPEARGLGHGGRIINWIIAHAKKQKDLCFLSLSSLPTAIKFYKKIGFREVTDINLDNYPAPGDEEDYVPGQVYMEYRIKGRRRSTQKKK